MLKTPSLHEKITLPRDWAEEPKDAWQLIVSLAPWTMDVAGPWNSTMFPEIVIPVTT
jgi:hypothetical protein